MLGFRFCLLVYFDLLPRAINPPPQISPATAFADLSHCNADTRSKRERRELFQNGRLL
jgi:hypothetical protein